jgi:hypothetical protein
VRRLPTRVVGASTGFHGNGPRSVAAKTPPGRIRCLHRAYDVYPTASNTTSSDVAAAVKTRPVGAVGPVRRRGADAYQQLTRAWYRGIDVGDLHDLGWAMVAPNGGLHRLRRQRCAFASGAPIRARCAGDAQVRRRLPMSRRRAPARPSCSAAAFGSPSSSSDAAMTGCSSKTDVVGRGPSCRQVL